VSSLHSENYSTSKHLKVSPEKSQILSCDTVVANERYAVLLLFNQRLPDRAQAGVVLATLFRSLPFITGTPTMLR
jgi:hypothetical protein